MEIYPACISVFQDTCQGITNIVVSLAENHTKLILDGSLEQDETKKSNMIKLTHLVLVSKDYGKHHFFKGDKYSC